MLIQRFLRQQCVCLTVARYRRRPDQLRDLMTVLKLRAVDFDYCLRFFSRTRRLPLRSSLSGAGRPGTESFEIGRPTGDSPAT